MARRTQKNQKKNSAGQARLLVFMACVSLVALILISAKDFLSDTNRSVAAENPTGGVTQPLVFEKVTRALRQNGVPAEQFEFKNNVLTANFKHGQALLPYYQKAYAVLKASGASSIVGAENALTDGMELRFETDRGLAGTVRFVYGEKIGDKAIAILIDDFGYNKNGVVRSFIDFPVPITYAIIPGLPFSKSLAEELNARKKTIIVHMPMEPLNARVEKDGFTLLTSMPAEEIKLRMKKAVEAVPFAIGLNNHMGSKATADSSVMLAALSAISAPNFLFVDSRTSSVSVAYDIAVSLGVQSLRNNIFLDPVDEQEAIEKKIHKLAEIARANGVAIGIGHPRPNTLAALEKLIPQLQEQGFQFVTVRDLRNQKQIASVQ